MVDFKSHLDAFEIQWKERLGDTGEALARDLRQLVDLLLIDQTRLLDERIKEQVASWALINSDEKIPLEKISKEGLAILLANPGYISNGELMEILKQRFPDM